MIYGSMRELLEEDLRKVDRDLQKNGEVLQIEERFPYVLVNR